MTTTTDQITTGSRFSVKVFVAAERGPVEKWFATRLERALWLLENGYSSMRILGFCDPENDTRLSVFDVDDLPKPMAGGMNDTGISKGEKVMATYHHTVDGRPGSRTIVMVVESAWFMAQPNRMYISDGDNRRYIVESDSVRIVA
jgi:hypothetical protein